VVGYERERSYEIADLAIDFAVAGLQTLLPTEQARNMGRVNTRSFPPFRISLCFTKNDYSFNRKDNTPGRGIGGDIFIDHLIKHCAAINSIGNRIAGYLSGDFRLQNLQQQWCDAAYWFHEGLAEPIESIAVAKLETAIEVLLRSESMQKSRTKFFAVIEAFYGVEADKPINPKDQTTVKQLMDQFVQDRSRILHGTWPTLGTELRASRLNLTLTLCELLHDYTLALDQYALEDSIDDETQAFLDWVKNFRIQKIARASAIAAAVEPKQK
jgi:hypothetical protein